MIYLLEDDDNIRKLVIYTLESQGYKALGFSLPSLFRKAMEEKLPELILLDIMLPEEDGMSVLKKLKSNSDTKDIPVIIITAKNSEYDKVIGLDCGADDFVTKPFGMMELVARIRAVMRRSCASEKTAEFRMGDLYVCPGKHIVKVQGENINLTYKEFEILCLLLSNKDIVLSRNEIMDSIWGYDFERENRTLDVHIRTLRSKLKTSGNLIETVRGIGYKIGDK